jgi:hypothetical protein
MLNLYCRKKKTDSDSSNGTTTYATTTEIIYGTPKPRPEYVYGTLKRYVDCRNCRVQCLQTLLKLHNILKINAIILTRVFLIPQVF